MLEDYGIYSAYSKKFRFNRRLKKDQLSQVIKLLLGENQKTANDLIKALIKIQGKEWFIQSLTEHFKVDYETIKVFFNSYIQKYGLEKILLTGAEALSLILKIENVKNVFAYPGTSELVLCDTLLKIPGIHLINARGDKEAAFMAAGGCLIPPVLSAAVLHGARGLTNAMGAIADARRNEIGTIIIVGLPSTSSLPFLPPHGEVDLIKNASKFVKSGYEVLEIINDSDSSLKVQQKIKSFVSKVKNAIYQARCFPYGPTLIGIPQDLLEKRWITYETLVDDLNDNSSICDQSIHGDIAKVCELIKKKKHPLVLVDDFLFKNSDAKTQLVVFAETIKAPVLQIKYRRGPMLFEKISSRQNPYFAGAYNMENKWHQKLMKNADLLITLEDRNAYTRVVGVLPDCQKIAITANEFMTKKNKYLKADDFLIIGNTIEVLKQIIEKIPKDKNDLFSLQKYCAKIRKKADLRVKTDPRFDFMRKIIAEELSRIFRKLENPILVDDSQMFGGLLFESYDKFPAKLRVFGDHGAFIGGGIAYSVGLAQSNKKYAVFCSLGDQSFTNGFQGLVCAVQEKIKVIYLVCNNGRSVSLLKQAISQDKHAFDEGRNKFLHNSPNLNYSKLAKALGLSSYRIKFNPDSLIKDVSNPKTLFRKYLSEAIKLDGPVLIELELPSNPLAWLGIWAVKGNEEKTSGN